MSASICQNLDVIRNGRQLRWRGQDQGQSKCKKTSVVFFIFLYLPDLTRVRHIKVDVSGAMCASRDELAPFHSNLTAHAT